MIPLLPFIGLLVPVWVVLVLLGRSMDRGRLLRLLVAGGFVGFVGAICLIELRRYGLAELGASSSGGLADAVRFFLVGVTAGWIVELFDARTTTRPGSQSDS